MTTPTEPWLDRAQRLAAIAQTGLHFADSPFDVERYEKIRTIAAEMLAEGTGRSVPAAARLLTRDDGYATPKIDVRAVVMDDHGHLLLVRERSDGRWALPGGFADVGDGPRSAVEREVREESGYDVAADRILAVFDRRRHAHPPGTHHLWKIFIACALTGGSARTSVETSDVGFFPVDRLPELSTIRVTDEQIGIAVALHDRPDRPAHFD